MGLSLVWFGIVTVVGAEIGSYTSTWHFVLCHQSYPE